MKKIIKISIISLIIDILSKQIILKTISQQQSITIIKNFFYLTLAKNTGVAFSFLEGNLPLIIIMTIIVIIIILKYLKTNKLNKYENIGYGLILGGAIGNLLDRIIYGYVIDFLDFNLLGYPFPIFNLADTFIVIGVLTLLILNIIESRNQDGINRIIQIKNR